MRPSPACPFPGSSSHSPRRTFFARIGTLAPLFLVASVLSSRGQADAERPNVVLILSDDQAWNDYGFMGHETIRTPNLDRLAARSRLFPNGYVVSPLCRPSLASIVTGLPPHRHGVVGNDVSPARSLARDAQDRPVREAFHRFPSLIRFLTERGYLAHQSGKWWEGSWREGGFTHGMTDGDPERGGRHGDAGLKIGRDGLEPIRVFLDEAGASEKPFFLWYAPFLPHTPHNPPETFLSHYRKLASHADTARYFAMCEWFDATCGELMDEIDRRGLTERTLFVYLCDNGWVADDESPMPLPEGWWPDFAPKSKGSPYETGIRTPIFFSLPGSIEPRRDEGLASSLDIFPTIAALCGFDPPDGLPGIDLLREEREQVTGAAYSIHNMTPGTPFDTLQYAWLRIDSWKYLRRYPGKDSTRYRTVHDWDRIPVQLFDLSADPGETENLADRHPDLVSRFQRLLEQEYPKPPPFP